MAKAHMTINIDEELKLRVTQRKMIDKGFIPSHVCENALRTYLEGEDEEMKDKREILEELNEIESNIKSSLSRKTQLMIKLDKIKENEKKIINKKNMRYKGLRRL